MQIYSKETKRKYLLILKELKQNNAFSYKDISGVLNISERTITAFFNEEIIRMDILEQVLGMNGVQFTIEAN